MNPAFHRHPVESKPRPFLLEQQRRPSHWPKLHNFASFAMFAYVVTMLLTKLVLFLLHSR